MCVGLSAKDRAADIINLPDALNVLPPPGLSVDEANECQNKRQHLAPNDAKDYYNQMIHDLQEELDAKTASKNKAKNKKKKAKKAKIAAANNR